MSHLRAHCDALIEGENRLSPEESHHLGTVRRTSLGASVALFDGAGRSATGILIRFERRCAVVAVTSIEQRPFDLNHRLTLAFTPAKQQRQSYAIEKCTELGVRAMWPMVTARSVTKPSAGAIEKWRRRAIEAVKQSGRMWVPEIQPPQSIESVLARAHSFALAGICDTADSTWGIRRFFDEADQGREVLLLVGPEGGWTDEERAAARSAGVVPVSLGPTILRAETAAVAAVAACAASTAGGIHAHS